MDAQNETLNEVQTPEHQDGYENPAEKKVLVKQQERVLAAISYAPLCFLLPIAMKKEGNFISLHMRQSAVLFIAFVILIFTIWSIHWLLSFIITIAYIWLAGYAASQAYAANFFSYKIIEKFFKKID